jgi:hypothetical protein
MEQVVLRFLWQVCCSVAPTQCIGTYISHEARSCETNYTFALGVFYVKKHWKACNMMLPSQPEEVLQLVCDLCFRLTRTWLQKLLLPNPA